MRDLLKPIALAGMVGVFGVQARAESPYRKSLVDSKPWHTITDDGREVNLTFKPDGSAVIKLGIMSHALSWDATADGLCLRGTPKGDVCMHLEKIKNGYVGFKGKDAVMTFTR